jgi:RNA-splicing ligase RtcB
LGQNLSSQRPNTVGCPGALAETESAIRIAEIANVAAVVDAADAAGLARKVARVEPLICIKG